MLSIGASDVVGENAPVQDDCGQWGGGRSTGVWGIGLADLLLRLSVSIVIEAGAERFEEEERVNGCLKEDTRG